MTAVVYRIGAAFEQSGSAPKASDTAAAAPASAGAPQQGGARGLLLLVPLMLGLNGKVTPGSPQINPACIFGSALSLGNTDEEQQDHQVSAKGGPPHSVSSSKSAQCWQRLPAYLQVKSACVLQLQENCRLLWTVHSADAQA